MQKVEPSWSVVVLVCANERDPSAQKSSCGAAAGRELRRWLRDRVREHGQKRSVLVSTVRCLSVCPANGTTVCTMAQSAAGMQRQTMVVDASADREALWDELKACLDGANT